MTKKPKYKVTIFTSNKEFQGAGEDALSAIQNINLSPPEISGKTYAKIETGGKEKVIFFKPFQLKQIYGQTNNSILGVVAKRLSLII